MPIEIKELHLKFNLERSGSSDSSSADSVSAAPSTNEGGAADQQDLVQTCVEEVLRILELKSEDR